MLNLLSLIVLTIHGYLGVSLYKLMVFTIAQNKCETGGFIFFSELHFVCCWGGCSGDLRLRFHYLLCSQESNMTFMIAAFGNILFQVFPVVLVCCPMWLMGCEVLQEWVGTVAVRKSSLLSEAAKILSISQLDRIAHAFHWVSTHFFLCQYF